VTWFLDKAFLEKLDLGAYDAATIARCTGVSPATAQAFVDPKRFYWVKSSPDYGWLAGANRAGKPTLLFVGQPRLSAEGSQEQLNAVCTDHDTRIVTTHAIALDAEADWDTVLDVAEKAIGFEHVGNAPMLAFKHPGLWHYAVVPFPFHLHDAACGDGDADADADLQAQARDWIESGNFVLHCGNAYFMGAKGDVESS